MELPVVRPQCAPLTASGGRDPMSTTELGRRPRHEAGLEPGKRRPRDRVARAGTVLAVLAAIGLVATQSGFGPVPGRGGDAAAGAPGGSPTVGVIGRDLEVSFGAARVELEEFGLQRVTVPVVVTNRTDRKVSFDLTLEARSSSGGLITTDDAYLRNLARGQSAQLLAFNIVNDELIPPLLIAQYRVAEARIY